LTKPFFQTGKGSVSACASAVTGRSGPTRIRIAARLANRTRRPIFPIEFIDLVFQLTEDLLPVISGRRVAKLFHRLLDRETTGPLARRKLLKALQVLSHKRLRRDEHEGMLNKPSDIVACFVLSSLERV